ncbi:outer membrane protein assembly factor BamC [Atlantibacter subterraneus]|jgi:outer membrane protein assembly factor BamC|uniref:Outer membrane protein assembly factor BamC n=1 Tax=Atlantibacter subterraneus TaxID=255519 RepID=A0ABU4E392_9ENTR|nr:outer membrane protein assembly factor BamC [Atlantibacter subterranea]MDZ5666545.1 outer membrane protein assembly factor BamC [Atlantibacter hermannii]MDV7023592.1 outer membrane protein assembly factor BamC [Atlantibacter subterranea]MDW2743723.1 outer membrane protein assembly factor BamC [Atlantibacter subterranea]TSJ57728.1 outer membrane protein assembly factor BamC [Atlantibacter subterranea]UTJ46361.1 outer membrane protein assembly factor BamC [Atlantibacter subterranea]
MAYSVQKSRVAKVATVSLVMLLAACSSDSRYKRQVSGDESYLDAAPLAELHAPAGLILPVENGDYNIPVTNGSGRVGKELDIRPPAQPLALVTGARTQFTGDTATLLLESGRSGSLWPQVVSAVQSHNYPITKRDDAAQTLSTDWVQWNRADEDQQYRGRYQITVQPQGYQQALVVKLVNLEQDGKPVADSASLQRYSAEMLNSIASSLDKTQTANQNAADNRNASQIDVQSAADDTGLPMLVVRAPFNVVWTRLPATLEKVGMKVTDSTRSTGSVALTYKPLSDGDWQALGARDPGLSSGDYKLQVGDLDNRSSLQFIDPKGHTLTQSQNDALVAVFQAAFSK